jgi:hypothetical protein
MMEKPKFRKIFYLPLALEVLLFVKMLLVHHYQLLREKILLDKKGQFFCKINTGIFMLIGSVNQVKLYTIQNTKFSKKMNTTDKKDKIL